MGRCWVGRMSPGVGAADAAPPPGSNHRASHGRVSSVIDDFALFSGVVEMNSGRDEGGPVGTCLLLHTTRHMNTAQPAYYNTIHRRTTINVL